MPRISKLVPDEKIIETSIRHNNLDSLDSRMTGYTTGVAIAAIGIAMQNPEEKVFLGDRSAETGVLIQTIRNKIEVLGLKHLEFVKDGTMRSLVYNIYR